MLRAKRHFDSDTDAAAGAASGDAAASAAAFAVCIYYVVKVGRFAPPYKYIVKYIQQKQQQKQLPKQPLQSLLPPELASLTHH